MFLYKSAVSMPLSKPDLPVIDVPDEYGGGTWDPESWVASLFDNDDETHQLWCIIGAILRPNVPWDKALFFVGEDGAGGKSTVTELLRALVGVGNYSSMSVSDFTATGSEFRFEELPEVMAIIADENEDEYLDKSKRFKLTVTKEDQQFQRKYQKSITVALRCIAIQCFNSDPRIKDRTSAFYRRLMYVPFLKNFLKDGTKNPLIKRDYVHRKEVLEYILYKVMHMEDYYEIPETESGSKALAGLREDNDPIMQFWLYHKDRFMLDYYPTELIYDIYRGWHANTNPASEKPAGQTLFRKRLASVLRLLESDEWSATDSMYVKKYVPNEPVELLILEYDTCSKWRNPTYKGDVKSRICTIPTARMYNDKGNGRGFLRITANDSCGVTS